MHGVLPASRGSAPVSRCPHEDRRDRLRLHEGVEPGTGAAYGDRSTGEDGDDRRRGHDRGAVAARGGRVVALGALAAAAGSVLLAFASDRPQPPAVAVRAVRLDLALVRPVWTRRVVAPAGEPARAADGRGRVRHRTVQPGLGQRPGGPVGRAGVRPAAAGRCSCTCSLPSRTGGSPARLDRVLVVGGLRRSPSSARSPSWRWARSGATTLFAVVELAGVRRGAVHAAMLVVAQRAGAGRPRGPVRSGGAGRRRARRRTGALILDAFALGLLMIAVLLLWGLIPGPGFAACSG